MGNPLDCDFAPDSPPWTCQTCGWETPMVDRAGNPIDWGDTPPAKNCEKKRKRVSEAVYAARIAACAKCENQWPSGSDRCCGPCGPVISDWARFAGAICDWGEWPE